MEGRSGLFSSYSVVLAVLKATTKKVVNIFEEKKKCTPQRKSWLRLCSAMWNIRDRLTKEQR